MSDSKIPAYVSRSLSRVENMPLQLVLSVAVAATLIAASSLEDLAQRREGGPIDHQLTQSIQDQLGVRHSACTPEHPVMCSAYKEMPENELHRAGTDHAADSGTLSCSANPQI